MSEEEKKAIKNLQEVAEKGIDIYEEINVMENEDAIRIVLNLIKKQQKEIEEWKANNEHWKDETMKFIEMCLEKDKQLKELKEKQDYARLEKEQLLEDSIRKDKIREKIKQFQDLKKLILKTESETKRKSITYDLIRNDYCEDILKELLEE